ncbi:MAG: diguanylate cyclase (GGDEF)-like protein [Candidatus Pseudothioglobus sp.]
MDIDIQAYRRLIDIGSALSAENDTTALLERILREAKTMAGADAGRLYLRTKSDTLAFVIVLDDRLGTYQGGKSGDAVSSPELPLYLNDGAPNLNNMATRAIHEAATIRVDDVLGESNKFTGDVNSSDELSSHEARALLTVPLTSLSEEPMGVLQLLNAKTADDEPTGFSAAIQPFIESLASLATMALQNRKLLDQQEAMKRQLEEQVNARTEELRKALRKLSEAHVILKDLNTIDAVTRIKNRQYFDDIAVQEWRRAVRQKYPMNLMLLDIDKFKRVNDTYGHLAGDACLQSVAQCIDELFNRPSDVVARYGGEEFIVIMPYIQHDNAMAYAERVRAAISAQHLQVDGHSINVTISIGVASGMPDQAMDLRQLIARADTALYEAKRQGRDCVCGIDLSPQVQFKH